MSFLAENQAKFFEKLGRFSIKLAQTNENDITFMKIARIFSQMNINGSVEKLSYELHINV